MKAALQNGDLQAMATTAYVKTYSDFKDQKHESMSIPSIFWKHARIRWDESSATRAFISVDGEVLPHKGL